MAHRKLAEFFLDRGRQAEAIASLTRGIELKAGDGMRWAERAEAYASLGETVRAIADYTQALQRDARRSDWLAARSALHQSQHDYSAALRDLNQALQHSPRSSGLYKQRAELQRAMGLSEAAALDEDHAREFRDWPTAAEFVFFLAVGLMLNWVKAAAGIGAALLIRDPWASASAAVAIGVVADIWPVLDTILSLDPYILVTAAVAGAASVAWWAIGRGIRRVVAGRLRTPAAGPRRA